MNDGKGAEEAKQTHLEYMYISAYVLVLLSYPVDLANLAINVQSPHAPAV
jgi:hypothetical protein